MNPSNRITVKLNPGSYWYEVLNSPRFKCINQNQIAGARVRFIKRGKKIIGFTSAAGRSFPKFWLKVIERGFCY